MTNYVVRDYGERKNNEKLDRVPESKDYAVNDAIDNYNTTSLWWWLDKARSTGRLIAVYDESNEDCALDWS